MALRGRRINSFLESWCLVYSGGLEIWVSSTSFQKSNIGRPQQPTTEKVAKIQLDIWLVSQKICVTSAASAASMASLTSTAQFHQLASQSWWLDHPWHQNNQNWSFFVEWIIKNLFFADIWYPCCLRLLRPVDVIF